MPDPRSPSIHDMRLYHRPLSSLEPKGFHREDIKAMVRKRGSTLRRISLEAGLYKEAASFCLVNPLIRANRAVSEFLQIPLHVLWPEWFDAQGRRIRRSRRSSRHSRAHLNGSHEKCLTNDDGSTRNRGETQ